MPERPARVAPGELARRLGALDVEVERLEIDVRRVDVIGYGDAGRPSSVVRLSGGGHAGRGEHVGFSSEVHERFARRAASSFRPYAAPLARWLAESGAVFGDDEPPHARAAVEAALVDLALRQHASSLAALAGVLDPRRAPMAYAISFAPVADPARRVRAHRAETPGAVFKIDVDPRWDARALDALGELADAVAVLDFKERGDAACVRRLADRFPGAWLEDPPLGLRETPADLRERLVRDMPVRCAADVDRLAAGCGAINLKAPRMGGVLALLAALERADALGLEAYLGGMFEVDVGRAQARQLAALFTGGARNDLAPIPRPGDPPPQASPLAIPLDGHGFGAP